MALIRDWRDRIKTGDVLSTKSGSLRVVRRTNYQPNGRLYSITFAIKRCSWTGRCYTILNRHDIKNYKLKPTGTRSRMRTLLDRKLNAAIISRSRNLDCCDVKGVS